MKELLTVGLLVASLSVAGCASTEMLEAGRSGCDPRSPRLEPFTAAMELCKRGFPSLGSLYAEKEARFLDPASCDVLKGDRCREVELGASRYESQRGASNPGRQLGEERREAMDPLKNPQ